MKHVDTIVLVEDIKRSRAFYSDVIGLSVLHDWESMLIFKERFSIHQADLLLPKEVIQPHLSQGKQGRNNIILYFESENLEEDFERVKKSGAIILHGILHLQPWQKIFRCFDPDGHIVEIGNPLAEPNEDDRSSIC